MRRKAISWLLEDVGLPGRRQTTISPECAVKTDFSLNNPWRNRFQSRILRAQPMQKVFPLAVGQGNALFEQNPCSQIRAVIFYGS
jgi:hypothetical protein